MQRQTRTRVDVQIQTARFQPTVAKTIALNNAVMFAEKELNVLAATANVAE